MDNPPPGPVPTYLHLRDRILGLNPRELGLDAGSVNQVWGVLMETGYDVGTASLVVLADGTTSLNYSTGGGMLGSPGYTPVAEAAKSMVALANEIVDTFSPAGQIDLPSSGTVKFTLLTFSGKLTAETSKNNLESGRHPLSQLYQSGQETIGRLRLLKDKKRD